MKKLYNLAKLELNRLLRNKVLICVLLLMPIVVVIFCGIEYGNPKMRVGLCNEVGDISSQQLIENIQDNINIESITNSDNLEQLKQMVCENKLDVVVHVYTSEIGAVSATFYLDNSQYTNYLYSNAYYAFGQKYAFTALKNVLSEDYGININEDYFFSVDVESANRGNISVLQSQLPFVLSILCAVSIMFGLIYIIARDNETCVSRQLSFTPMNVHLYLWSKILPLLFIGMIECLMGYGIIALLFKVRIQINGFALIFVTLIFCLSSIMLGLLINLIKNQVTATLLTLSVIILPLFALIVRTIRAYPVLLQGALYCLPLTSFVGLQTRMIFNGYIQWEMVAVLLAIGVIYYILTFLILRKRIGDDTKY